MPRYDYSCSCGSEFEVNHQMDDKPEIYCPECNNLMFKKLSIPNVAVKGDSLKVPIKTTGDPLVDKADPELNARIDEELNK